MPQQTHTRQGSVAVRRLANPVTLCNDHGVFFVAASGQIRMAANSWRRRRGAHQHVVIAPRVSLSARDKTLAGRVRPSSGLPRCDRFHRVIVGPKARRDPSRSTGHHDPDPPAAGPGSDIVKEHDRAPGRHAQIVRPSTPGSGRPPIRVRSYRNPPRTATPTSSSPMPITSPSAAAMARRL